MFDDIVAFDQGGHEPVIGPGIAPGRQETLAGTARCCQSFVVVTGLADINTDGRGSIRKR